jgi:predicted HTH transcriptional regulator
MGVTSRTIENYLSKLKDDKVIEREGSTKSGLWKIIGQQ